MISQKQKAPKRTLKEELQVKWAKLPLSLTEYGEPSVYQLEDRMACCGVGASGPSCIRKL